MTLGLSGCLPVTTKPLKKLTNLLVVQEAHGVSSFGQLAFLVLSLAHVDGPVQDQEGR